MGIGGLGRGKEDDAAFPLLDAGGPDRGTPRRPPLPRPSASGTTWALPTETLSSSPRRFSDRYSFRERSENAEIATELSLLPWRAFQPDGVILFSDILTLLPALGVEFEVLPGAGPVIADPVASWEDLRRLRPLDDPAAALPFVGATLAALRAELGPRAAVLGFAPTPWTLAGYVVEGRADRRARQAKTMMLREPRLLTALLDALADAIAAHLEYQVRGRWVCGAGARRKRACRRMQRPCSLACALLLMQWLCRGFFLARVWPCGAPVPILPGPPPTLGPTHPPKRRPPRPHAPAQAASGAQVLQLFDSWAHHLTPAQHAAFGLRQTERVLRRLAASAPGVPVVLHTNGCAGKLASLARLPAAVLSVDWQTDLGDARRACAPRSAVLQGNVDPTVLFGREADIAAAVRDCLQAGGPRGHIMNLGHGVIDGTPEEAVAQFVRLTKQLSAGVQAGDGAPDWA